MMEKEDIEKVLESLDGIKKAEPRPFFSGRVLNRMENISEEVYSGIKLKLGTAILGSLIIISLNSYLVFSITNSNDSIVEFVEEYELEAGTIYFQDQE